MNPEDLKGILVGPWLRRGKVSLEPGDVNYLDARDTSQGLRKDDVIPVGEIKELILELSRLCTHLIELQNELNEVCKKNET